MRFNNLRDPSIALELSFKAIRRILTFLCWTRLRFNRFAFDIGGLLSESYYSELIRAGHHYVFDFFAFLGHFLCEIVLLGDVVFEVVELEGVAWAADGFVEPLDELMMAGAGGSAGGGAGAVVVWIVAVNGPSAAVTGARAKQESVEIVMAISSFFIVRNRINDLAVVVKDVQAEIYLCGAYWWFWWGEPRNKLRGQIFLRGEPRVKRGAKYWDRQVTLFGAMTMVDYTFSNVNLCAFASIFILSPSVNFPASSSVARRFSSRCWIVRFRGLAPKAGS